MPVKKIGFSLPLILRSNKLLILITLLGAALFFFRIGRQSLWLDEALTLNIARNWNHMVYILSHSEPYMWTYLILLHFWMKFGNSEGYLRGLSALFAIISIPFFYVLGRKLFGSSIGITAAFLLSINTFFIRYAQEIRAYSLLVFVSTVLSYFYILLLEKPTFPRQLSYILIASLGIYTHQFVFFIIISHFISLFFKKKAYNVLLFIFPLLLGIGLFCLPLFFIRVPLLEETSWISQPRLTDLYSFTIALAGGSGLLLLLESIIIFSGFVYFLHKKNTAYSLRNWYFVFTCCLLFLPFFLVVFVSYLVKPIFVPRYLIFSVIPFILLMSYGLFSLGKKIRHLILSLILIGSASALLSWYGFYNSENAPNLISPKDNWRGTVDYIFSQGNSTDSIIFYPYYIRVPFIYYADRYAKKHPSLVYPAVYELASGEYIVDGIMPEPNASLIQKISHRSSQVWLILSHNNTSRLKRKQQTEQIESMLEKYYSKGQSLDFNNIAIIKYLRQLPI